MELVTYDDVAKVELRAATIIRAEVFPKAKKPAYKIWADFGQPIGILQTSAQITVHYTLESLVGQRVMGCINLGEKNIAGFISQFLLMGFADECGAIRLATIEGDASAVPNGAKLH